MNNPNKATQKDFDTLPLFLSKQADHEIEIKENDVEGVIYIAIDSEDDWFGFNFKARITKSYTVGELWKDGWACLLRNSGSVSKSFCVSLFISLTSLVSFMYLSFNRLCYSLKFIQLIR